MRNIIASFVLVLAPLLNAAAAEIVATEVCTGCDINQIKQNAHNYSYPQLAKMQLGDQILYHSLDLNTYTTTSVRLTVHEMPFLQTTKKIFVQEVIATTPALTQRMQNLKAAVAEATDASNSITIPASLISHPWEWVNCAYCENDVNDFLKSRTNMNQALYNIEEIAKAIGLLKSNLPNTYQIAMENGGFVRIKLSVDANGKLYIKIWQVVDKNNNTVPLMAVGLAGMRIKVDGDAALINYWINAFSLGVYDIPRGTVTITDCKSLPSCGKPGTSKDD